MLWACGRSGRCMPSRGTIGLIRACVCLGRMWRCTVRLDCNSYDKRNTGSWAMGSGRGERNWNCNCTDACIALHI
jgi:hypothetical protein